MHQCAQSTSSNIKIFVNYSVYRFVLRKINIVVFHIYSLTGYAICST
ncbi:hypothetical protein PSEUDO8O_120498 [Pseudomonas sp. 8O]|nr:hypothetical protein PSEUDO8O_120498 [Pseudomonas sp. 8O]